MTEPLDLLVAGEIYIDQVLAGFSEWPQPGEEAVAQSLTREVGGGAPHTAAGLIKLGRYGVTLIGPVGRNDFWLRERLGELGLDSSRLWEHPTEPTGTTIAVSMPDERTFFTYRGANGATRQVLQSLPKCKHLHLAACCDPQEVERLSTLAKTVSVDAGWHPAWLADPDVHRALRSVAWFLPNEIEAAALTGETQVDRMLRRFEELGIRAAVKLGAAGSAALDNGRIIAAPPVAGVDVVDTTGAGDCFDAGFLDAWLNGAPLSYCLEQGNLCGALSTRRAGGMNGFPTREELGTWRQSRSH